MLSQYILIDIKIQSRAKRWKIQRKMNSECIRMMTEQTLMNVDDFNYALNISSIKEYLKVRTNAEKNTR